MGRTFGRSWQDVNQGALAVIGKAAQTQLDSILSALDQDLNTPLRMYAAATPDSKLYFAANQLEWSDGALRTMYPLDDTIQSFVASTIDFQTGATTGGTFKRDGTTFSIPDTTVGYYRRVVFVYNSANNWVDCAFGQAKATFGELEDPGTIFATLAGTPIGYIDLESTGTSAYKTIGSSTSVIENKVGSNNRIFRIGVSGGGAAGDPSFKLSSVSTPNATIKGGYLDLSDGKQLATNPGSGLGKDLTVSLTTIYGGVPATGNYYLYVDLNTLGSSSTSPTTGRVYYPITISNLVILTTSPESTSLSRYVPLGAVHSNGSAWSMGYYLGTKRHDNLPLAISPTVFSDNGHVVGAVGSSGQIKAGHLLTSDSFPSSLAANLKAWFNLREDSLDKSGNGVVLSNSGSTPFTETNIIGEANKCAHLNGSSNYFSSTDSWFNPGDTDFTFGFWVSMDDWTPASLELIQTGPSSSDRGFYIYVDSTGMINLVAPTGASSEFTVATYRPSPALVDGSFHHLVVRYTASTNNWELFFDNEFRVEGQQAMRSLSSPYLILGAGRGPTNYFPGRLEEFFWVKAALTDKQIAKIYSSRIDHNKNIAQERQQWSFNYYPAGVEPSVSLNPENLIVDKSNPNSLYLNFKKIADDEYRAMGSFIPTVSGLTGGSWAGTGTWKKEEDTVDFDINGSFSGTPAGSTNLYFSFPFDIDSQYAPVFVVVYKTTGAYQYLVGGYITTLGIYIDKPTTGHGMYGSDFAAGDFVKISVRGVKVNNFSPFSYANSTDKFDFRLQDAGFSNGITVPIQNPEFVFNATGQLTETTTSYPTNLPDNVRSISAIGKDASNNDVPIDVTGRVWVTPTGSRYLQGNIDSLSDNFPIRITCSCLNPAVGVGTADGTTSGIISTAKQLLGGLKKFLGGSVSVEYVGTNPEVGGSSPFQLTDDHKRVQILNPGSAITVKLPTTNIKAGEKFVIVNRSSYDITVQSSDATQITVFANGKCECIALQDTPTNKTHWRRDVWEGGTFQGNASTTNYTSVSGYEHRFTRHNNVCTFSGAFLGTVTTTATDVVADVTIPRGGTFAADHHGQGAGCFYRSAQGLREALLVYSVGTTNTIRVMSETTGASNGATSCVMAYSCTYTVEGDY